MDQPTEKESIKPEEVKFPYITLGMARSTISLLFYSSIALALTSIILAIGFSMSINRKPWVIMNTPDGFLEVSVGRAKIMRSDVERFLNFVIPNIYGTLNGEAPGLSKIRGMVNENIIIQQEKELEATRNQLRAEGISQFAIVTGINPETLVINRERNFVYVEALGTIVLTKENRSKRTDVQWRCLMYIVEPTDALISETAAGKIAGNRMGLFLEQIAEQPPGTINTDSPKPTASDIQERQAEAQAEK